MTDERNDLIRVDDALDVITDWLCNEEFRHGITPNRRVNSFFAKVMLENVPRLADHKTEHKRGEWIRGDAEKLTGKWRCSICGNTIYSETKRDREKFHAFCGHCGADMREREGE